MDVAEWKGRVEVGDVLLAMTFCDRLELEFVINVNLKAQWAVTNGWPSL